MFIFYFFFYVVYAFTCMLLLFELQTIKTYFLFLKKKKKIGKPESILMHATKGEGEGM